MVITKAQAALLQEAYNRGAVPVDNASLRVARRLWRRRLMNVSPPNAEGKRLAMLTPAGSQLAVVKGGVS